MPGPEPSATPEGNPAQWEAISFSGRACLVLAGPGSGKTFVLVRHIRYLVQVRHVRPESILVLTFSRAAARQMQRRYEKLGKTCTSESQDDPRPTAPAGSSAVTFGTFHSVFYHILRESSGTRIALIDPRTRQELLDRLAHQYLGSDADERDIQALEKNISLRKSGKAMSTAAGPGMEEAYAYYETYLSENHLIDFDDMILACAHLMESDPAVLLRWRRKFRYILIDEFQDISPSQYHIIRMLEDDARGATHLFCVGDDDQSIYSFRGADPAVTKQYLTDHPHARTVRLQVNYRSGRNILRAASKVIAENQNRIVKRQISGYREQGEVSLHPFVSEREECAAICGLLQREAQEELVRTAVIFRTHTQAAGLWSYLRSMKIPVYGRNVPQGTDKGADVIKDIEAYFRLARDSAKGSFRREDYYRVMNRPERYLTRKSASSEEVRPAELLRSALPGTVLYRTISDFLQDLSILAKLRPPMALRFLCRNIGYRQYALNAADTDAEREEVERVLRDVEEKADAARDHSTFLALLEQLLRDQRAEMGQHNGIRGNSGEEQARNTRGVHIITMHASKGLEFDTVIIPDLNEGILPSRKSYTPEGVEEERRLFYVAMTRARKTLYLCYVRGSSLNPRLPSRFLNCLGVENWV